MSNRFNKKCKLPEEEVERITKSLKAIKLKNVEEMRKLSKTALEALEAMEKIENDMDEEARMLYPDYPRVVRGVKLTFQRAYQDLVMDGDGNCPSIETIRFEVQEMNQDANATPSADEAAAAITPL